MDVDCDWFECACGLAGVFDTIMQGRCVVLGIGACLLWTDRIALLAADVGDPWLLNVVVVIIVTSYCWVVIWDASTQGHG